MPVSYTHLRFAINISAAVLIITCPCALGLAVPAVVTAASGKLFRKGLLIKHGTALERLADVDMVVFDKTGTLTMGAPEPTNLADHPREVLEIAVAMAAASSHPLSTALAEAGRALGVSAATVTDLREVPGYGAVSYTHLDVYKRQGQLGPLPGWLGGVKPPLCPPGTTPPQT